MLLMIDDDDAYKKHFVWSKHFIDHKRTQAPPDS
jgi:hypothetical protein